MKTACCMAVACAGVAQGFVAPRYAWFLFHEHAPFGRVYCCGLPPLRMMYVASLPSLPECLRPKRQTSGFKSQHRQRMLVVRACVSSSGDEVMCLVGVLDMRVRFCCPSNRS